jgi:hypothetical protein
MLGFVKYIVALDCTFLLFYVHGLLVCNGMDYPKCKQTVTEDYMTKKQNRGFDYRHMPASSCLFRFKFHTHSPPSVCVNHVNSPHNHRQLNGAAVNGSVPYLTRTFSLAHHLLHFSSQLSHYRTAAVR